SRVALWKSRNANAKSAAVRMNFQFIEFPNKLYKIRRVLKIVITLTIFQALRSVAPERKNVAYACAGVAFENFADLFLPVADAGEMRNRILGRCLLDAHDKVVGELSRRATGAVGYANKVRLIGFQLADGLVESFYC